MFESFGGHFRSSHQFAFGRKGLHSKPFIFFDTRVCDPMRATAVSASAGDILCALVELWTARRVAARRLLPVDHWRSCAHEGCECLQRRPNQPPQGRSQCARLSGFGSVHRVSSPQITLQIRWTRIWRASISALANAVWARNGRSKLLTIRTKLGLFSYVFGCSDLTSRFSFR